MSLRLLNRASSSINVQISLSPTFYTAVYIFIHIHKRIYTRAYPTCVLKRKKKKQNRRRTCCCFSFYGSFSSLVSPFVNDERRHLNSHIPEQSAVHIKKKKRATKREDNKYSILVMLSKPSIVRTFKSRRVHLEGQT